MILLNMGRTLGMCASSYKLSLMPGSEWLM
jgi:hypothetical protein